MNNPQVVITRKYKKLHKFWHLFAFTATGGASAPITATRAVVNAKYNADTRRLADPQVRSTYSERYQQRTARRSVVSAQAREELGLTGIPWKKLSGDQKRMLNERKRDISHG